jgi:hypothetical protein
MSLYSSLTYALSAFTVVGLVAGLRAFKQAVRTMDAWTPVRHFASDDDLRPHPRFQRTRP